MSFVLAHQDELSEIAIAYLDGDTTTKSYRTVKIDGLFDGEHQIVQFLYSGFGIAPSSKYYGFYYSPDDIPVAHQNVKIELEEVNSQKWEWTDGTDNGGITKKICDHWYYYKAWF